MAGVERFAFISSVAVYGIHSKGKSVINESSSLASGKDLTYICTARPSGVLQKEDHMGKEPKKKVMNALAGTYPISGDSILVVSKDQVSADLAGESVILNLKDGVYYGLNAVGSRIWNLFQEPKCVSEIRDVLMTEYKVEPDQCERELLTLLEEMVAKRLN